MNNERAFNFDLSKSHRIEDVNWPSDRKGEYYSYDDNCHLILRLPGGGIFKERLKQVAFARRGDSVSFIKAHMHNMTLDEIREDAKRLMNTWHFDDRKFAAWYDKANNKKDYDKFETIRNDLQPALALKVLYSFNDERPWFISFEVTW